MTLNMSYNACDIVEDLSYVVGSYSCLSIAYLVQGTDVSSLESGYM
jgi:hypothetical protein